MSIPNEALQKVRLGEASQPERLIRQAGWQAMANRLTSNSSSTR